MADGAQDSVAKVTRTGGEILVQRLVAQGVRHVFTVPGESFLAVLDAMHDEARLRPITTRNEAGAAMMAEATGKLTGQPGVALVTRGPGAANALPGVYIAHQDQSPMLLLAGMPPRTMDNLPAFQSIDLERVFGGVSKWCAVVPDAARLDDYLARAFECAMSGRRGPVVLGLPEDVLSASTIAGAEFQPVREAVIGPRQSQLDLLQKYLAHAERPLVIAGSSRWSAEASHALTRFAERFDLPVASAFRRQDAIDNRHRCYVGHLGLSIDRLLSAGVRASDLVIVFGSCLGEVSTQGYKLLTPSKTGKTLVVISEDGSPSPFKPALTLQSCPIMTAMALSDLPVPGKSRPWPVWRRDLRQAYEASLKPHKGASEVLRFEDVIAELSTHLPDDAIVTNGAGNYAAFLHRHFVYKGYPAQLAPASGSMGYGLPAAIAAKLANPVKKIVALAGDGCFQMTGQELATAVQYGLPIVIVVANNGTLGTIRMHQERNYPGRVTGTTLINPDFKALAQAHSAAGIRVTSAAEFREALGTALSVPIPTLIEVPLEALNIAPGLTLQDLNNDKTLK